jgi:hypothetical protein
MHCENLLTCIVLDWVLIVYGVNLMGLIKSIEKSMCYGITSTRIVVDPVLINEPLAAADTA